MQVIMPETRIVGLNLEKAVDLIWGPRVKNDNILNSAYGLNVYKVFTNVKDGVRMLHLRPRGHALQSRKPCQWKPNFSMSMRGDVLTVCDYEHMSEDCFAEEFAGTCARATENAGNMVNEIAGNALFTEMDAAALVAISDGIQDDAYYIGWFADKNFKTDMPWFGNMELVPVYEKEQLYDFLTKCDGWWAEIIARNDEDLPRAERVVVLDSNDGTIAGNALNDPRAFLDKMIAQASPTLRAMGRDIQSNRRPVFLVQGVFFDAYVEQMANLPGLNDVQWQILTEGLPNPNMAMHKGFVVARMSEWDRFDDEIGGLGQNVRLVFTAQQNLCIGVDGMNGPSGYSVAFERSNRLEDKGKVRRYAALKLGSRIAEPELMVAAYNSSNTFVAA